MTIQRPYKNHENRFSDDLKKFFFSVLTYASLFIAISQTACSADKHLKTPKTVKADGIQVNTGLIPKDELAFLIETRQAAGQALNQEQKNIIREQLIARELFAQEARKAQLDKSHEFDVKARMATEEILAQMYQSYFLRQHSPADEEVRSVYDNLKQRAGSTEYHLQQIYVMSEEDAKEAVNRLDNKENFADLANAISKDEQSNRKGGDLGWVAPLVIQPQIANAIIGLEKGDYTRAPVKGPIGWHVLKVVDTRPFVLAPLEKLRRQLQHDLSVRALQIHLNELRKQADVR